MTTEELKVYIDNKIGMLEAMIYEKVTELNQKITAIEHTFVNQDYLNQSIIPEKVEYPIKEIKEELKRLSNDVESVTGVYTFEGEDNVDS